LAKVGRYVTSAPQPHRDHPYWLGAIAGDKAADEWTPASGGRNAQQSAVARFLGRVRRVWHEHVLALEPWHPRWPDFRLPLLALREAIGTGGEILIAADSSPNTYRHWLCRIGGRGRVLELRRLLKLPEAEIAACAGRYCGCLLVMTEADFSNVERLIARIKVLLQPSTSLFILVLNDRACEAAGFAARFARHSFRFLDLSTWIAQTSYVRSGPIRWAMRRRMTLLTARSANHRWYEVPNLFVAGSLLSIVNFLCDVIASRAGPDPPRRGLCSSVFLVLRRGIKAPVEASPGISS
jgi:hypothetical protein